MTRHLGDTWFWKFCIKLTKSHAVSRNPHYTWGPMHHFLYFVMGKTRPSLRGKPALGGYIIWCFSFQRSAPKSQVATGICLGTWGYTIQIKISKVPSSCTHASRHLGATIFNCLIDYEFQIEDPARQILMSRPLRATHLKTKNWRYNWRLRWTIWISQSYLKNS